LKESETKRENRMKKIDSYGGTEQDFHRANQSENTELNQAGRYNALDFSESGIRSWLCAGLGGVRTS
jgi:hypothetical protein